MRDMMEDGMTVTVAPPTSQRASIVGQDTVIEGPRVSRRPVRGGRYLRQREAPNLPDDLFDRRIGLAYVRVGDINIPTYQRVINMAMIRRIVHNYDPEKFGVLYLSKRANDTYWVIDGLHRLEALRQLGREDETVPAIVYEGLTYEQEAEMFAAQSSPFRRQLSFSDVFKARIEAGDAAALEIRDVAESLGLYIDHGRGDSNQPNSIRAVSALDTVYRLGGSEHLRRILGIIQSAFAGERSAYQHKVLRGMHLFLTNYGDQVNEERLINRLRATTLPTLLRKATSLADVMGGSNSAALGVQRSILAAYNYHLSESNRLAVDAAA
jgi:hypothetical protein